MDIPVTATMPDSDGPIKATASALHIDSSPGNMKVLAEVESPALEGHSNGPAFSEEGWSSNIQHERTLLDRCGDPDCPRDDCARGSFVDVRVFIGEPAGGLAIRRSWRGPVCHEHVRWSHLPHLLHMLRLAPNGGWSQFRVYTLRGWEMLDSAYPTFVEPGSSFLILRSRGLRDSQCPGIGLLIRIFHWELLTRSGIDKPVPRRYQDDGGWSDESSDDEDSFA